jgi:hypothetical protein
MQVRFVREGYVKRLGVQGMRIHRGWKVCGWVDSGEISIVAKVKKKM